MEIVEAATQDIPEIVELMKISLGEKLMPKSQAFFIWKHLKNPFGESMILLAKNEGKIIGLRTFMRWTWENDCMQHYAVRAVDTATHPSFQGKGIFSTLTKRAVELGIKQGVSFVFNSPNPISLKGYLKLGWYVSGKMPIKLRLGSVAPRFFSTKTTNQFYNKYSIAASIESIPLNWTPSFVSKSFRTPISLEYLQWRYGDCPVARYAGIIVPNEFGFVFRLKPFKKFIELRICESWVESDEAIDKMGKAIKNIIKEIRPLLVTEAAIPLINNSLKRKVNSIGIIKNGPVVTLRTLASNSLDDFNNFKNWTPSIGSMELF